MMIRQRASDCGAISLVPPAARSRVKIAARCDLGIGYAKTLAGSPHGMARSRRWPPSSSTIARIVSSGQIVGRYQAANGSVHGFLLSGGTYTTIDYPNAAGTELYGITDLGGLVGQWQDAAGRNHGFYAVKQ